MIHFIRSCSITLLFVIVFAITGKAQVVDPENVSHFVPKSESGAVMRSALWTLGPAAVGTGLILVGAEGPEESGLTIAIGIGIGVFGLTFGPGAGLSYAGSEQPDKGSLIRFAGCILAGVGVMGMGVSSSLGNDTDWGAVALFVGGGAVIWSWSAIHDNIKAANEVERYNREHGFASMSITPTYDSETKAGGLKLTFRF